MREPRKYECFSRCNLVPLLLFHAAAREGSGQVADQDDIVNRADNTVRNLKAFEIFQLKELVVDLADYN